MIRREAVAPHAQRFFTDNDYQRFNTVAQVYEWLRGAIGHDRNAFVAGTVEAEEWDTLAREQRRAALAPYLKLPDAPVVKLASKRRMRQPALKIEYETIADIQMRLRGSIIFIASTMFYIRDIYEADGDFLLHLEDKESKQYKAFYKANGDIDLRSIEPQYVTMQGRPYYVFRLPGRIQRQGMSGENMVVRAPGTPSVDGASRLNSTRELMKGITKAITPWSASYSRLMLNDLVLPSIRLSKNVAFFSKNKGIYAEYKGRLLGEVNENVVTIDDMDNRQPWIKKAIEDVSCTTRVR